MVEDHLNLGFNKAIQVEWRKTKSRTAKTAPDILIFIINMSSSFERLNSDDNRNAIALMTEKRLDIYYMVK